MSGARLVSAILEASSDFDPVWRANIGAHMDDITRSCLAPGLTVLIFRGSWYQRVEKTLDLEKLKHLSEFVGEDHLAYIRTTARGECPGGGMSSACAMPEGTELRRQTFKKLRELGGEAWNQYWTTHVKIGRGLFFSLQVPEELGL